MNTEEKSLALEWQKLICSIRGVQNAKVIFDENNKPREIHVLAGGDKSAKALTRDIQSAIMATYEVELDYRIISVARVNTCLNGWNHRLCYTGMDIKYSGGRGEIKVYLSMDEDCYEGTHIYTFRNPENHKRGVASATLDAVLKYIANVNGESCIFELMAIEELEIGGKKASVVLVCDEQGRCYLGECFICEHEDDAIVRSVLDALNRRIKTSS